MQQGDNNQYQNYGYDPYEQPPARGLTEKFFGARIAQRLRSPAMAAVIVLATGAAFAGVIAGTYSGGGDEPVPVIRAQADRFKTEPTERGGMDVPHRESTVFNTVRGKPFSGDAPVENLLSAEQEEEPADKLQAFERIAAEEMQQAEEKSIIKVQEVKDADGAKSPDEAQLEPSAGGDNVISGAPENKEAENLASVADVTPAPEKKEEKIAAATTTETTIVKETVEKISPQDLAKAETITSTTRPPSKLHTPGASPETIDFVRDVLNKKDSKKAAAGTAPVESLLEPVAAAPEKEIASIQPAAGDATSSSFRTDPSGTHFVQVASVPSPEATFPEWEKLQKQIPQLAGLEYRVSQAEVAGRGTFYRIQAGPFSKEQAGQLCDAIKAQKPSGCLVVR
jgi:hypothetical protein